MLVINYSLIEGLLCLYGVTIVFYFFIKKYTTNKKYNLKKILFAFVGIFFLENVQLCLAVISQIVMDSGADINSKILIKINIITYVVLALNVVIRAMLIFFFRVGVCGNKYGKLLWGGGIFILIIHDLCGVIEMNVLILMSAIIVCVINRKIKGIKIIEDKQKINNDLKKDY